MGNSNVREGFKRTGSKRYSMKKGKSADLEQTKTIDESSTITHLSAEEKETTNKEIYLQNLQRKLSQHEENLDRFVETTFKQNKKVDDLLQLFIDNASENIDNASQEEIIARQTTVMKSAVDMLKNTCRAPSKRIKDSFADVRSSIGRCLEHIEKDVEVTNIPRNKQEFEALQRKVDEYSDANRKLEKQVKGLKRTVAKLEKANKELHQQNKVTVNEAQQPSDVSAAVQLFHKYEGNAIREIEKELKLILKNKVGIVNFINCPSATDIDQDKLLIVVCIVSTRLSADAAKALKDIQNPGKAALLIIHFTEAHALPKPEEFWNRCHPGNAALLIIHFTEAHALPNQKSSRHLTDQRFKNLRGIFDMSFKSGNGFFQCDMNEESINELCSFCKQTPFGERL